MAAAEASRLHVQLHHRQQQLFQSNDYGWLLIGMGTAIAELSSVTFTCYMTMAEVVEISKHLHFPFFDRIDHIDFDQAVRDFIFDELLKTGYAHFDVISLDSLHAFFCSEQFDTLSQRTTHLWSLLCQ